MRKNDRNSKLSPLALVIIITTSIIAAVGIGYRNLIKENIENPKLKKGE